MARPRSIYVVYMWSIFIFIFIFIMIKDIINPYNCLLKNDDFSVKTTND